MLEKGWKRASMRSFLWFLEDVFLFEKNSTAQCVGGYTEENRVDIGIS